MTGPMSSPGAGPDPGQPSSLLEPDLVADLLARAMATGGRFAEVFAEVRTSTTIRLDDGKVEEVVSGRDRGAGIRVFHG